MLTPRHSWLLSLGLEVLIEYEQDLSLKVATTITDIVSVGLLGLRGI